MSYILIAVIAWVIFGIVSVLDKFLLQKPIHDPKVYTYYTGIFSVFAFLIFLPFAEWQGTERFILNLVAGAVHLLGQYFLFKGLMQGDVSEVVPVTGAFVPIFSLLFTSLGLGLFLTSTELLAFVFLVSGTIVISYSHQHFSKNVIWPLLASLFFAIYFVMVKITLDPFITNFAYVRLGTLIAGILMLLSSDVRKHVLYTTNRIKESTSFLFVFKSVLAGVGFIILNYAVSKGNPAMANALQGIEYVIIFIFAVYLSKYFPRVIKESLNHHILVQKTVAVLLIFVGLIFLQF